MQSCPFCNSTNLSFESYLSDGWVECNDCECRGPINNLAEVDIKKCKIEAFNLWNIRIINLGI